MSRGADKIIIRLNPSDGHFVYFTVHDEKNNGSIIDLVIRRKCMNLGEGSEKDCASNGLSAGASAQSDQPANTPDTFHDHWAGHS